jgi:hypothetical protein
MPMAASVLTSGWEIHPLPRAQLFRCVGSKNFDETAPDEWPSLAERIQLMRPQIVRLRANIRCFQEVNGQ